jgi:VanZ family protein
MAAPSAGVEDRSSEAAEGMNTIVKLIAAVAWASVAVIAYATLTHATFVYAVYDWLSPLLLRPQLGTYVHLEHIGAFALMATLFGLAYPRDLPMVFGLVLGAAIFLEILQTVTPDRHGTLLDALEKMAGGGLGILLAKAVRLAATKASRLTLLKPAQLIKSPAVNVGEKPSVLNANVQPGGDSALDEPHSRRGLTSSCGSAAGAPHPRTRGTH